MAKLTPKKRAGSKKSGANLSAQTDSIKPEKAIIPEKYRDIFYIGLLVVAVFIFFGPGIFGGGFNASDNIASLSFKTFVEEANEKGEFPLWIPYIFGGMPSYASLLTAADRMWDFIPEVIFGITRFVGALFDSDSARMASFYCLLAAGMYLLMRSKRHKRYVAFFTAFAATFSTSVAVWVMIGHNTKPVVFAMIPFVFLFLEKLRVKFSLLYASALAIVVHLMYEAGHLQMIFYAACAFAIYLIFELVSRYAKKENPGGVWRAAAVLVAASAVAFIMSSDRYISSLEYADYSTRGTAPIVKTANQTQDETGGNDYEYATMWSFSPQEIATFFVPSYFGFGKVDYEGPLTGGKEIKLPAYWGQKPFEDAAAYMGIFVLGLAIIGSVAYRRDIFVQFLIVLGLFAILLSFGSTLPLLYDFFFYYVPLFNKFRAPSMALALTQFAVPILAGYGLTGIIKWRENDLEKGKKFVRPAIVVSAVFVVAGFIFAGAFKTAYIDAVASSPNGSRLPEQIQEFIYDLMIGDWHIVSFIALAAFGLACAFIRRKIGSRIFFIALTALLVFDLWRVNYRPMEVAESKPEEGIFAETDLVKFLKQDKSVYRIADFAFPSPNVPAYFLIESVGGYHAAKLRVYQDLLDVADVGSTSQVQNPFLWNILNVKYIVTREKLNDYIQPVFQSAQTGAFVYLNDGMLPRAFFVDRAEKDAQINILKKLKAGSFDPRRTAFVEKDLPSEIETPAEDATAKVVKHENHLVEIKAKATGNNLLFISEIYYPPGWKAYIDGKETEIFKTNFAFRSIIVPEGEHTIELKYSSDAFELGRTLSLAGNILTTLALGIGIFLAVRRKKS